MTIKDVFEYTFSQQKFLIILPLDVGTKETFPVEICRGERRTGWSEEYYQWLDALNLEVDSLSVCGEDVCGNKDMLCVRCKPIKVGRRK